MHGYRLQLRSPPPAGLFFNFSSTAISRYCVEYLLPKQQPQSDPSGFADYVSCNGPEGRRWGNTPEDPICICDVWSDRMIAHQPASRLRQAGCHHSDGCACDDGLGGPPSPNKTSRASHVYIGRDPQYLPYFGPCCPVNASCPSCWDPQVQTETGGDFSTPRAGMCAAGQAVGGEPGTGGGCTWKADATVDVIYGGRDLGPFGWQFAPGAAAGGSARGHYPEAGDDTTQTTLHNVKVFEAAWERHDARVGRRCCGCGVSGEEF